MFFVLSDFFNIKKNAYESFIICNSISMYML